MVNNYAILCKYILGHPGGLFRSEGIHPGGHCNLFFAAADKKKDFPVRTEFSRAGVSIPVRTGSSGRAWCFSSKSISFFIKFAWWNIQRFLICRNQSDEGVRLVTGAFPGASCIVYWLFLKLAWSNNQSLSICRNQSDEGVRLITGAVAGASRKVCWPFFKACFAWN